MAQPWHFLSHLRTVEAVSCSTVRSIFFRCYCGVFFRRSARNTSQIQSRRLRWQWDGRRKVAVRSDAGRTTGGRGSHVLVSTPSISLVCKLYRNRCISLCNIFVKLPVFEVQSPFKENV